MSAAQIATLCIDDCMKAYVDHKPFTPKVLRIMNILDDAEAFGPSSSRGAGK